MKNMGIKTFATVLVVTSIAALGFMGYSFVKAISIEIIGNQARAEVVGEAPKNAFEGFDSFTADDSAFDVGVNVYGKTIFVDNAAALKAVKEKCALAIGEMRSQSSGLGRFRAGNIAGYYHMISETNWEYVEQEVSLQKQFLVKFLDYYIHGDPHQDVN